MVLKEAGNECEAAGREAVVKSGEQRLMLRQVFGLEGGGRSWGVKQG